MATWVAVLGGSLALLSSARGAAAGPSALTRVRAQAHVAAVRRATNAVTPDVQRARAMVKLFLRNGQRQAYQGEQVTRLLQGRVRESRQVVKHAGPARERIEYMAPKALEGEILLINGRQLYNYKPAQRQILSGAATVEDLLQHAKQLIQRVTSGQILVRAVGREQIAGQWTTIVEIRPKREGAAYKKFYIDETTGVRLKTEDLNYQGSVVATSFYTSIDYTPVFGPKDFNAASLPKVQIAPLFPSTRPLASMQDAQQQAGYAIRQPNVRPGFRMSGLWVLPAERPTTVLRYTDGVNTFAFYQQPLAPDKPHPATAPNRVRLNRGIAHWNTTDRGYILIGNLRPEAVMDIVNSTQ